MHNSSTSRLLVPSDPAVRRSGHRDSPRSGDRRTGRLPKSLRRKSKVLDRMNRMNRIARSDRNTSASLDPSTSRDRDSPLAPVEPVHPINNASLSGQRTWSTTWHRHAGASPGCWPWGADGHVRGSIPRQRRDAADVAVRAPRLVGRLALPSAWGCTAGRRTPHGKDRA